MTLCCVVLVLIPDEVKQRGMISGGLGDKENTNRKTPVREISILKGQGPSGAMILTEKVSLSHKAKEREREVKTWK